MNFAIIGRSELLYESAILLISKGFKLKLVITSKEASEYIYKVEDFKELAILNKASFINSSAVKAEQIQETIISNEIKIAISVNYTGILPSSVIELFKLGILNAHSGDLPKYKGNACQAWAIINGEEKIGLCIHKMIGGELDSGDIIERDYITISIDTRIGETFKWMSERIPCMFLNAVNKLKDDEGYFLDKNEPSSTNAIRCYPRNYKDGKIDFNRSREAVIRLINASSEPYSGAFCYLDGKLVKIWRAHISDDNEKYYAINGQITNIDRNNGTIQVITSNGKIVVTEIEIEGKRDVPTNFIQSIRKRFE